MCLLPVFLHALEAALACFSMYSSTTSEVTTLVMLAGCVV